MMPNSYPSDVIRAEKTSGLVIKYDQWGRGVWGGVQEFDLKVLLFFHGLEYFQGLSLSVNNFREPPPHTCHYFSEAPTPHPPLPEFLSLFQGPLPSSKQYLLYS